MVSIHKLTLPAFESSGYISGSYDITLPSNWFENFESFTVTISGTSAHYFSQYFYPTLNRDTHVYWVNFTLEFDPRVKSIQKFPIYNLLQTQFPLSSRILNIMAVVQ
jgi:hypothetical protein